ncbi:unnamed protein product [Phytophthora lilii]|uniref:RxLR effector protein n=1 Tax=Phytophthora lilii TaxID=2077276 RepID=A0A9W6TPR9_9STRA|nr:unnamed protein product [Phytophthora lilii]
MRLHVFVLLFAVIFVACRMHATNAEDAIQTNDLVIDTNRFIVNEGSTHRKLRTSKDVAETDGNVRDEERGVPEFTRMKAIFQMSSGVSNAVAKRTIATKSLKNMQSFLSKNSASTKSVSTKLETTFKTNPSLVRYFENLERYVKGVRSFLERNPSVKRGLSTNDLPVAIAALVLIIGIGIQVGSSKLAG